MQYLSKSFSVGMNLGEKGRANWERIFGKKRRPGKSAKPSAGMKQRAKLLDAHDQAQERGRADGLSHERQMNDGPGLRGSR